MAVFLWLSMIIIPYILGRGALAVLYRKQKGADLGMADGLLTGWLICIGLAEAAHLCTIFLKRHFIDCKNFFLAGLVLLTLIAALFQGAGYAREKKTRTGRSRHALGAWKGNALPEKGFGNIGRVAAAAFCVEVLFQSITVVIGKDVFLEGDLTVETVNSMLTSGTLYQVNPMTGRAYTVGTPSRLKILCLPTLYGILSDVFGLPADMLVWNLVPAATLLGTYLAYYTIVRVLFPGSADRRWVFMAAAALLLQTGDYMYGMDGFGVLCSGFRGTSIRAAILIPYTFGLIFRKKWKLVVLCILAEACIVWTAYGMGACFFITCVMIFLGTVRHFVLSARDGKEGACRS